MIKEWKYAFYIVAIVLVLAALGFGLWHFDPLGRFKRAEQKAATATTGQVQAQTATAAVERYHTQTIVIKDNVDKGVQDVQALPDAATPLSPERRAALCGSISRVRGGADPCAPAAAAQP